VTTYPAPSPEFIPSPNCGGTQTPTLVVMHATVGPTKAGAARAVARMFQSTARQASAHYEVDEAEVIQSVGDHTVAWHCGYNQDSIGVEMCFYPLADSLQNWLLPKGQRTGERLEVGHHSIVPMRWLQPTVRAMFRRSARLVAQLCLAYGIRRRYLGVRAVRAWDAAGRPAELGGITTHAVMSRAFKKSTHWDPGAWPRSLFVRQVRKHVQKIKSETGA
jgi:hypothetical protein